MPNEIIDYDAMRQDLQQVEQAAATEAPEKWPSYAIDDGYDGTILVTIFGIEPNTLRLLASVTVSETSSKEWKNEMHNEIEKGNRIFLQIYSQEGVTKFIPYTQPEAQLREQPKFYASLPPPVASTTHK